MEELFIYEITDILPSQLCLSYKEHVSDKLRSKINKDNLYLPSIKIIEESCFETFPISATRFMTHIIKISARKRTKDDDLRESIEYQIKTLQK